MTLAGVVTTFAVPYAPRIQTDGDWASAFFVAAPKPDPGALRAAQARLTTGRLVGGDVLVLGPVYRPVWLGLTIAVTTPLSPSLREQIVVGFETFLDPLVGGDEGKDGRSAIPSVHRRWRASRKTSWVTPVTSRPSRSVSTA